MSKAKEVIRIIGDVHGKTNEYLKIIEDAPMSVQVGDFAFDYSCLRQVDAKRHSIVPGNHDNYDTMDAYDHFLLDYGEIEVVGPTHKTEFYFVRGAPSVDCHMRVAHFIKTGQKSWWYEEEIPESEWDDIKQDYAMIKPQAMITHDCPSEIVHRFSNPGVLKSFGWNSFELFRTQRLLQELWEIHQPKIWFFGHYHKNYETKVDNTRFVCLNELCWADVNFNWEVINRG